MTLGHVTLLALAVAIAPALRPVEHAAWPLALSLLQGAARGAPVAVGAALLVHTALMAGGVIDGSTRNAPGQSRPRMRSSAKSFSSLIPSFWTMEVRAGPSGNKLPKKRVASRSNGDSRSGSELLIANASGASSQARP